MWFNTGGAFLPVTPRGSLNEGTIRSLMLKINFNILTPWGVVKVKYLKYPGVLYVKYLIGRG